jgi:hypothetical protein
VRPFAAGLVVALVAGAAGVGALQTSWGQPVRARVGGCPATCTAASETDALRLAGLHTPRGAASAPARPALGFVLDRTTPRDVRAWAARAGVRCNDASRALLSWRCAHVPRDTLAALATMPAGAAMIEDLELTFDPGGRLVSVDAVTRRLRPAVAAAAFAASDARLRALLGPASERDGDPGAEALARAPLAATAVRRYRFNDYVAILSVSRLSTGLAVRELYLSN